MNDRLKSDIQVGIGKSKNTDFTTAMTHYFNRRSTIERISTGSKNIDNLLYGGVETKAVTEFYGAPSSGKTQVCHTMCAIVPQDKSEGGVGGKSIYIDMEGTFRAERIAQIASKRGFDPNMTLDNVIIREAQDIETQERILDDIDPLLKDKTKRFKFLVVDSPVTHYRSEYIGRQNLPARQQKLYRFMRRLVAIAQTYNIAVVITNHINTTPNSRRMSGRPAGGNVMGHAVTYSIRLWTLNQFVYHATIVSSPYHPTNSTTFYISEKGLVDDNPSADELPIVSFLDFDLDLAS
jgi:DNA repair protein RadA